jgi:YjbR
MMPSTKIRPADALLDALRAFGLQYPGAHTKSPWPGHLDLAVDNKTFVYLSVPGEPLVLSCKLPNSAETALTLPYTKPTSYGLGHSGWVTAEYPEDELPPFALLQAWLDESYRAQAPKKLVSKLDANGGIKLEGKTKATAKKAAKSAPLIEAKITKIETKNKVKAPGKPAPKTKNAAAPARKAKAAVKTLPAKRVTQSAAVAKPAKRTAKKR